MLIQAPFKRHTVDIDTRRTVVVMARVRKPFEVAGEGHEAFITNALKDKMSWPKRDPAPESIKVAAKEMAAFLVARDKAAADAKAILREAEKLAAQQAIEDGVSEV